MPTQTEEQQAAEFLKRAEIRTMIKDLRQLREADALKERDKIAKIKTLEEQRLEQEKKLQEIERARAESEKAKMEKILLENAKQERLAEKDLKNYATEQERQRIFLLESQRVSFEKESDAIDKEKEPVLKLEKNKLLLQKRDAETKLKSILEQEKRLEDEQKIVIEKSQTTQIASQKKSLEQRKWDLDKEIQNIEKKRWAAEKQVQDLDNKIKELDKFSQQLVEQKNSLRDKILGIDKSLRDIYSGVIVRFEEKRRKETEEQKTQKEILSKLRAEEKERIQREQWGGLVVPKKKEFLKTAPESLRARITKSAGQEEEQRAKFLKNVENLIRTEKNQSNDSDQLQPPKKI